MVTVFTPSYNRAQLLESAYKSLSRQTCKDFEWIVIDDGSSDNTQEVIDKIILNNGRLFPIRNIKKENGGKHTAINLGLEEAKGELFLILDSDDSLAENCIETIINKWGTIKKRCNGETNGDKQIGGLCFYMAHHNGNIIGHPVYDNIITDSINMRYKLGIKGDMLEVFCTSVLREFPFPQIPRETFCPESLVWNRVARKYKLQLFNNIIYFRDYLEGGLTSKMTKIRMQSPIASMMCYSEMVQLDIPFRERMKAAINYWRFRFCSSQKDIPLLSGSWFWTAPLGWMMHLNDIRTNKMSR